MATLYAIEIKNKRPYLTFHEGNSKNGMKYCKDINTGKGYYYDDTDRYYLKMTKIDKIDEFIKMVDDYDNKCYGKFKVCYGYGELKISYDDSPITLWNDFIKKIFNTNVNFVNGSFGEDFYLEKGVHTSNDMYTLIRKERWQFKFTNKSDESKIKSILESARDKLLAEEKRFEDMVDEDSEKWNFFIKRR